VSDLSCWLAAQRQPINQLACHLREHRKKIVRRVPFESLRSFSSKHLIDSFYSFDDSVESLNLMLLTIERCQKLSEPVSHCSLMGILFLFDGWSLYFPDRLI
jgi:hypothetical protein